MTASAVATQARPRAPYVLRSMPRTLVLGSFLVVTLPLAWYRLVAHGRTPIIELYFIILGMTHFFLTFVVYLSSANVRHFLSSRRNIVAFIVAPLVPLFGLAAWYGLGLSSRFVLASGILFTAIRGLDFYHLSRQSFGVLQLFKNRLKGIPPWTRTAENLFFLTLAALMFSTYASDLHFDPRSPLAWALVFAASALLVAVVTGYAIGLRAGADRKQTLIAIAYFGVQSGSALLAVYQTSLYVAALAVHYVEYHVLMAPRVLKAPVEPGDRVLSRIQRTPALLYGSLLGLSLLAWFLWSSQGAYDGGALGPRFLVHVFDGVFVFHYIIEMSIWKFSDPYFRKSLGPLYT
jgi:hypothetical protein